MALNPCECPPPLAQCQLVLAVAPLHHTKFIANGWMGVLILFVSSKDKCILHWICLVTQWKQTTFSPLAFRCGVIVAVVSQRQPHNNNQQHGTKA